MKTKKKKVKTVKLICFWQTFQRKIICEASENYFVINLYDVHFCAMSAFEKVSLQL